MIETHVSINLWNIAEASTSPKGIQSYSSNPSGPTVNAVSGLDVSSISTCQWPDLRSSAVNQTVPLKLSKESSILGRFYASLIVWAFNFLRSMQNQSLPSFLCTNMTRLAHGLCNGHIAPISSISFRCFLTSSYILGGIN